MKNHLTRFYSNSAFTILIVLWSMLTSFKGDGCVSEQMNKEAVSKLKKYSLIENYPFYMKKKKKKDVPETKKVIVTLNNGMRYKFFSIKNPDYEGIPILTIYNNEKMEFMVASTYNANMNKFYNDMEFECKTTGNYCLVFSFFEGEEGCGLGIYSLLASASK